MLKSQNWIELVSAINLVSIYYCVYGLAKRLFVPFISWLHLHTGSLLCSAYHSARARSLSNQERATPGNKRTPPSSPLTLSPIITCLPTPPSRPTCLLLISLTLHSTILICLRFIQQLGGLRVASRSRPLTAPASRPKDSLPTPDRTSRRAVGVHSNP